MSDVIKTARPSEKDRVIDILVLAFSADPIERWLYPDPQAYLRSFPIFLTAFTARSFQSESAYCADGYAGAAFWLPPNVSLNDEQIVRALKQTVDERKQADTFATLQQMGDYHPHEPHWYLPIMGVDVAKQGHGIGSELLRHALASCDRDQSLAYLESTNPKNIPLYERHGFELIGTIQAGACPPMFPMLRKPHHASFSRDNA